MAPSLFASFAPLREAIPFGLLNDSFTIQNHEGAFMRRLSTTFFLLFAFTTLRAFADSPAQPAKPAEVKLAKNEIAIYVGDMHCAHCAKKIAGKLYRVKGVVKVRTDVKKNLAIVTPQAKKQVDSKAAWAAVRSAGFKPTKLIGPQGTFVADQKTKDPVKAKEAAPPQPS
jgi:copper chaperone CopZ